MHFDQRFVPSRPRHELWQSTGMRNIELLLESLVQPQSLTSPCKSPVRTAKVHCCATDSIARRRIKAVLQPLRTCFPQRAHPDRSREICQSQLPDRQQLWGTGSEASRRKTNDRCNLFEQYRAKPSANSEMRRVDWQFWKPIGGRLETRCRRRRQVESLTARS